MKIIKQYLTEVICGVVALLAVVACLFWPLPGWRTEVQTNMAARMQMTSTIKNLAKTPLELPGAATQYGPPSVEYIEAKKGLIGAINDQQKQVADLSKQANMKGRVTEQGVPILPVASTDAKGVAAWGKLEPGYLPKVTGVAAAFKVDYGAQFPVWAGLLANGVAKEIDMESATPPKSEKLKLDYQEMQRVRATTAPPGSSASGLGAPDPKEEMDYERSIVLNKAADLRMYVDSTAFQVRPWLSVDDPPTDQSIFEGMVDSWLQADVVKAIHDLNASTSPLGTKDIGRSPVKRLIHITVGNSARVHMISSSVMGVNGAAGAPPAGGSGGEKEGLFYTSADAPAGATGAPVMGTAVNGGGAAPTVATPNVVNFDVGMTGHSSGGEYDVVLMSIWMDIDPAYLNSFKDHLYRQNMGYAVVNEQWKTVDPLDRVSNGYIYGPGQVVEVELQVEAILFRSWTAPLMPAAVKAMLGVPETPAK